MLNFSSFILVRICFNEKKIIIELPKYIQTELGPSSIIRDSKNGESIKRERKEVEGREARDKKVADIRKLREENQKRTERIKDRRDKQLKIIRDEKVEKQSKIQQGMKALKEIQKYQKGEDLPIQRVPFQRLVREIVQK